MMPCSMKRELIIAMCEDLSEMGNDFLVITQNIMICFRKIAPS